MSDQQPPASTPTPQQQQVLLNAVRGQVPGIYANGFGIIGSASDLTVVLMLNNNPVAALSLSHISAKSLRNDLSKAIDQFEKATKQEIKTIPETAEQLKSYMGGKGVRIL